MLAPPSVIIIVVLLLLLFQSSQSISVQNNQRLSIAHHISPSTSTLRSMTISNDEVSRGWRIWSVIDELNRNGLSSSKDSAYDGRYDGTIASVIQILQLWGDTWAGEREWNTLLNKKSLLHEVEESIIALHYLEQWLEQRTEKDEAITLVDVCCGKGILSMLASYLFCGKISTHVANIIMLDKQQSINWNHIKISNEHAQKDGRPIIQSWGGCNLHEIDQIVEKLECINGPLAIVGIHLCKQLSPACVGVVNTLGDKCPFFCLAPCCLPRIARNLSKSNSNVGMIPKRPNSGKTVVPFTMPVRTYESIHDRQARQDANKRREQAKKRSFADLPCFLCSEIHPIHKCNLLPVDENERLDIFARATALQPCWKCGEVGHKQKDCPSSQEASTPRLVLPPTRDLDLASILHQPTNHTEHKGTFEKYSELLATAIQRDNVQVVDSGLVNNAAQHNNPANSIQNWNRDRKSLFIISYTHT